MNTTVADISFAPWLPWWALGLLAAAALLVTGYGMLRRVSGMGWRAGLLAVLLLALCNPALVEEQRLPQNDIVVIAVDESPSRDIGNRAAETEEALATVQERLAAMPGIEARVVRVGRQNLGAESRGRQSDGGTRLVEGLRAALAEVPPPRRGGTIVISDGQVHDAADGPALAEAVGPSPAPVHLLLTGRPGEADRRIEIVRAPAYGIVGQEVEILLRVDDLPAVSPAAGSAQVLVNRDGEIERSLTVTPGREHTVSIRLERAGSTVIEFETEPGAAELTTVNNRAVAVINAVRDRLRVLLVSGRPHAGERVWRNLLKSDPAVDLVHFTILRPPEKQDSTPIRELSLISFPIRELFEEKLADFDLVVFDRYERRGVIPNLYLDNMARFVREGGALLEVVGPGFADPYTSLARTPLGAVFPSEPSGQIFESGFRPSVTDIGSRHPVTESLSARARQGERWGRWFRHVDADVRQGATLMNGVDGRPLLVLDRVGSGRVGQLLSDHIWLWARGYEGGGPHDELVRRLAHWLMKEPDLEERALTANVVGDQLLIERRSTSTERPAIMVTDPLGRSVPATLAPGEGGRSTARVTVDRPGLYRVGDGDQVVIAAAGPPNPVEYADVRATADRLAPLVEATGGTSVWLSEGGVPEFRRVRPGNQAEGRGWIGLRANRDFTVAGLSESPMLPGWLLLLLVGGGLVIAWRREAR